MTDVVAYGKQPKTFSMPANADLSANQYYPIKFSSGKAIICTTLGEKSVGLLQNDPSAADQSAVVAYAGISRAVVGTGGATQGSFAVATTDGLTDQSDPDQFAIGVWLSDGSVGEILPLMLTMSGSIGSADLDGGVLYKSVTIATADILTAFTTPVELVAAPGANKVLELMSSVMFLDYNSAGYATNGNLTIQTGTTGTAQSDAVAEGDFLFLTADAYRVVQPLSADVQGDANESLVLGVGTGNPATGDSPLIVHVAYRIHDFS